jgi:hypothetical protein
MARCIAAVLADFSTLATYSCTFLDLFLFFRPNVLHSVVSVMTAEKRAIAMVDE